MERNNFLADRQFAGSKVYIHDSSDQSLVPQSWTILLRMSAGAAAVTYHDTWPNSRTTGTKSQRGTTE